jgi:hypothetical protein
MPVYREERVMPHEEPDHIYDQKLLRALYASANHTRDIVRRTLELIEQSRIMLRELDIREAEDRRTS